MMRFKHLNERGDASTVVVAIIFTIAVASVAYYAYLNHRDTNVAKDNLGTASAAPVSPDTSVQLFYAAYAQAPDLTSALADRSITSDYLATLRNGTTFSDPILCINGSAPNAGISVDGLVNNGATASMIVHEHYSNEGGASDRPVTVTVRTSDNLITDISCPGVGSSNE